MSDAKGRFERLVSLAREETAPGGDVSGFVVSAIREDRLVRTAARPMLVFAAAYAVACVVALAVAYGYGGMDSDPMTSFFAMANEVMP